MTPRGTDMNNPPIGENLVVLTLELQSEMFAIAAEQVHEILDPVPVTEVPGAAAAVSGLINVRGRIVPLADPRHSLGMPPATDGIDARFVVLEVELDGDPVAVAIRADKVHEVTELLATDLEATPRLGVRWPPAFIRCIGKHRGGFITVLDLGRVFASVGASAAA